VYTFCVIFCGLRFSHIMMTDSHVHATAPCSAWGYVHTHPSVLCIPLANIKTAMTLQWSYKSSQLTCLISLCCVACQTEPVFCVVLPMHCKMLSHAAQERPGLRTWYSLLGFIQCACFLPKCSLVAYNVCTMCLLVTNVILRSL